MATRERVYRMDLDDFNRYLQDRGSELQAAYKEIEEVQFQFNDLFKQELAAWQEVFSTVFPRVLAGRKELPADFAALIDRAEQAELAALKKEIAELDKQVSEGRSKMDQLTEQAQQATRALRNENPDLNDAEERIKAELQESEDEYARLYEQIDKLDNGLFGWLTHAGQLSKLKSQQGKTKRQQAKLLNRLREVRQDWQEKITGAGERQAALRKEWEDLSVRTAQAQGRLDYLQANLEALAAQNAVQKILEGLEQAPRVPGELGTALEDLTRRNQVRGEYETGLRAVAEALGLTKGVGEGMTRFQKSVATVLEEQRRFNLKQIKVELPERVVQLHETWKALRTQVKDEKYLGKHPLEFSRIIDRAIKERLTDASIQDLFETMGHALDEATAAWK
jgi:predicted  nucleic acid-binding Zn-ribbon protein